MTFWRQPLDRDRIEVPHGIVHIIEERCKGCGLCVDVCSRENLRVALEPYLSEGTRPPGNEQPSEVEDQTYGSTEK